MNYPFLTLEEAYEKSRKGRKVYEVTAQARAQRTFEVFANSPEEAREVAEKEIAASYEEEWNVYDREIIPDGIKEQTPDE